jgi:Protein of unknown function (DUF1573)
MQLNEETLTGDIKFGNLIGGMKYKTEIRFRNPFSETVKVEKIKASCGCLGGYIPAFEFEPERTIPIRVLFTAPTQRGPFRKVLSVFFSNHSSPVQIRVDGDASPILSINPGEIALARNQSISTKLITAISAIESLEFANEKISIDDISSESAARIVNGGRALEISLEENSEIVEHIRKREGSVVSLRLELLFEGKKFLFEQSIPVTRYWGIRTSPKTIWLDNLENDAFDLKIVIVGLRDEMPGDSVTIVLPSVSGFAETEVNVACKASPSGVIVLTGNISLKHMQAVAVEQKDILVKLKSNEGKERYLKIPVRNSRD